MFDPKAGPEWVQVDVRRVRVERGREFGGSWLALKLWQALEFAPLLERCLPGRGEEIRWGLVGCILTAARLDSPGSAINRSDMPCALIPAGRFAMGPPR